MGFIFHPMIRSYRPCTSFTCTLKANNKSNEILGLQIKEALSRTKPKEFHFHHPGEAWKFQLAGAFKWVLTGFVVLALSSFGAWHWSRLHDVEAARTILQQSGNVSKLLQRIQRDDNGDYFIDFTAGTGDSVKYCVEYEKLDRQTVRVYLGRESK